MHKACKQFVALLLPLVSAHTSHGLSLIYETGPLTGQAFSSGQLSIKFVGFGTGANYDIASTPIAGSGAGANAFGSVGVGVNALDALQIQAPIGASLVQTVVGGVPQGLGSISTEDAWTINRVTEIVDLVSGDTVWSQSGKASQLTAITSGLKDFYYNFDPANQRVTINSVGVRLDLYEVSTVGFPNANTFNTALGPFAGHGGDLLGNGSVYAGTTNGAPILSLRSVPGFINPDGILGGVKSEFQTNLNLSGSGGNGNLGFSFLDVIGGSQASAFDNNGIQSGIQPGLFTDVQIQFTQTTFGTNPDGTLKSNPFGWISKLDDPLIANYNTSVPEPGTMLAALLALSTTSFVRRRKAQASVTVCTTLEK